MEGKDSTGHRPSPAEAFWDRFRDGELVLPFCRACQRAFFYPRRWCPLCWSDDLALAPVSGMGTVYAVTVVHVAFQGLDESDLPSAVGLVDLDEGVRVPAGFPVDPPPTIGDRVVAGFEVGRAPLVFRVFEEQGRN